MKSLIAGLNGKYRAIRERVLRRILRGLVSASTFQARMNLRKIGSFHVLIDSSALAHGITHETAWISTGTKKWGPYEFDSGYAARIPVHSPQNESRLYKEIQYLVGIAVLAKQDHIQVYTSAELLAEQLRQPWGRFAGYGYFDLNLFKGIKIESVDGSGIALGFGIENPALFQRERISTCKDPLFLELLEALGSESSQDVFHIFTAEKHGMNCFLHIDFPLADRIRQLAKKSPVRDLKTKVLLPSMLGKQLGLLPVHTNILSYEDSGWFVHPDLHMPDQRRQKRKANQH